MKCILIQRPKLDMDGWEWMQGGFFNLENIRREFGSFPAFLCRIKSAESHGGEERYSQSQAYRQQTGLKDLEGPGDAMPWERCQRSSTGEAPGEAKYVPRLRQIGIQSETCSAHARYNRVHPEEVDGIREEGKPNKPDNGVGDVPGAPA